MLLAERRGLDWEAASPLRAASLGAVSFGDVTNFFAQVVVPAFGVAANVYKTYTSYQLGKEALRLQEDELEVEKAKILLEYAYMRDQAERQEKAADNPLGVPYGNAILLGFGVIGVALLYASRR